MKKGHGPAPVHIAEKLVIILATNSNLHPTCCILVANILFYHMRHVSYMYFTSSVAEGRDHEVFYSITVKDQLSLVG